MKLVQSKSDDFLSHRQASSVSPLKERKPTMGDICIPIPVADIQKRNSYHSLWGNTEKIKQNQITQKKKLLAVLLSMGYNSYMADYVIQKEQISMDLKLEFLIPLITERISEIDKQHHQISEVEVKHRKQSTQINLAQVVPVDQEQIPLCGKVCSICLSELTKSITLECEHQFCNECVTQYLTNKIMQGQVLEITCPQDGCCLYLQDKFIQRICNVALYEKYLQFKEQKLIESDDNIRWCIRPGCSKYIKGNMFSKTLQCICGQQICFNCRLEAHEPFTCEVIILCNTKQAIDKHYEEVLKQLVIQKCPRCRVPIQKREGCNHMTCYQCRFQFCWICRARYTRMHYDADNCFGCPDLQFAVISPQIRPKWKKYGGICFELFVYTLLLPFVPFIMIWLAILAPLKLCKRFNRQEYTQNYNDSDKCCLILIGMLTFPIFFVFEICPGFMIYIAYKLRYD